MKTTLTSLSLILLSAMLAGCASTPTQELRKHDVDTKVKIYDGETIVLGGMLTPTETENTKVGLPIFVSKRIVDENASPVKVDDSNGKMEPISISTFVNWKSCAYVPLMYAVLPLVLVSPTKPPEDHIYNEEGAFVRIPAHITSLRIINFTGMAVTVPLSALYEPFGVNDGDLNLSLMDGYRLSANILYTIGGLPFYIVKKLLWDGPVYLYETVAGEEEK